MQAGSWLRIVSCAACLASSVVFAQSDSTLYLRSTKTGRCYGPFEVENGRKIMLGASEFTMEVEQDPDPEAVEPIAAPEKATPAEQAALDVANAWLELIDAGDYEHAWSEMASFARSSLKESEFSNAIRQVQESLGRVTSRKLARMDHATSLPAAPDGHYIVITYAARMKKKMSATEVVVPMLDVDGKWRISGYTVR